MLFFRSSCSFFQSELGAFALPIFEEPFIPDRLCVRPSTGRAAGVEDTRGGVPEPARWSTSERTEKMLSFAEDLSAFWAKDLAAFSLRPNNGGVVSFSLLLPLDLPFDLFEESALGFDGPARAVDVPLVAPLRWFVCKTSQLDSKVFLCI
jgi:hypothetical protein